MVLSLPTSDVEHKFQAQCCAVQLQDKDCWEDRLFQTFRYYWIYFTFLNGLCESKLKNKESMWQK